MLQPSLGLRCAWRDNGTLTFCEVKNRLHIRIRLLQAAASRSEGQYILPGVRVNWETIPARLATGRKGWRISNTTPFPWQDESQSLFDSLPAWKTSHVPSCFYQQTSEGQLTATQRATGSVPTCSKHIWGSPSVGVSICDVAALTRRGGRLLQIHLVEKTHWPPTQSFWKAQTWWM